MTKLKCWKKVVNQKDNMYWQVGVDKNNPRNLPKKWINVSEHTPYIKKEFGYNWEVRTPTRINKDTVQGTSKNFKTKPQAIKFAKSYMKKHDKC